MWGHRQWSNVYADNRFTQAVNVIYREIKEDIAHYQCIVVALKETIRLMEGIDEVIDSHGGWPIE